MKSDTFGAIDIGSNAIRMLVNNVESYEDGRIEYKKAAFVRVPIRLGDDVFLRGSISEGKIESLCEAMKGFAFLFRAYGVRDYRAYATSAMREAGNGADVAARVKECSGIPIEIISGDTEADTIFAAGGLKDYMDKTSGYLYVDVGGGSTEIVVFAGGKKAARRSFRLGTVRILSGTAEPKEWKVLSSWLGECVRKWHPAGIIGSGGNINKIHKMLEKKSKEGVRLKELSELYERLSSMDVTRRMEQFYLNRSRAEVIVPALKIFLEVMKQSGITTIAVPRQGLADGIIHMLYRQYSAS